MPKYYIFPQVPDDIHLTIFPFLSLAIRSQLPKRPTDAVEQQAALQMSTLGAVK